MNRVTPGLKQILKIVNIALLYIAAILTAYGFAQSLKMDAYVCIGLALVFITLIAAIIYCMFGFKKNATKFYKIFVAAFAFTMLFKVYGYAAMGNPDSALTAAFSFGMLCILFEAKDMGRTKSRWIGTFVLIANVLLLIRMIIVKIPLSALFGDIAIVVLAIILCLMILAKYEDKAERGSN